MPQRPCFNAYVDESGDEGFVDVSSAGVGSSEWFVVAAAVFPATLEVQMSASIDVLRLVLNRPNHSFVPIHFRNLHPGEKGRLTKFLATTSFRFAAVAAWKPGIPNDLQSTPALHHHLLRRLSNNLALWSEHQQAVVDIRLSRCVNIDYNALAAEMRVWRDEDASLQAMRGWTDVSAKSKLAQIADSYASATAWALEQTRAGTPKDQRFLQRIHHQLITDSTERAYGLGIEIVSPERGIPEQYAWLTDL